MLRVSRVCCISGRRSRYNAKLRHRFRSPTVLPLQQTSVQRSETIERVMARRPYLAQRNDAYRVVERRLYAHDARLAREGAAVNTAYALQGLGDDEPLRSSRNFGLGERALLKYHSAHEAAKYEEPPVTYTALTARKLAEGRLWPRAPTPSGMLSREVSTLRHRDSMSPSARTFTDKIAYHLRRSLRACPAHIAEHLDFSQLMVQDVLASRRSREVYVVWSTVDPAARFTMEPYVHRLSRWVQRLIRERIHTRPNLPRITWIYDGQRIPRALPRSLEGELKSLVGEATTSIDTRVRYLRELDTVNQRMRDVPWFMPYLWNKEAKAQQTRRVRSDVAAYEQQRLQHKAARTAAAQRAAPGSGRSVAPQTAPPPSYVY